MALQIRRGTDVDRQGITPKAGEPIFTTDTKKLYIGDGTTAGGIIVDTTSGISNVLEDTSPQLGGNLDMNNNDITGTGNIAITGEISATAIDLKGSIFADDSTLLIDGINGTLHGNLTGDVTGDITGSVFADDNTTIINASNKTITGDLTGDVVGDTVGYHTGDVTGSIFSDDSALMVDAINNDIQSDSATITNFNVTNITVAAAGTITAPTTKLVGDNTHATIELRHDNGSATLADQTSLGRVLFCEDTTGGANWTIDATKDYMIFSPNYTGTPDYTKFAQVWRNGKFQIGGEAGLSGFAGLVREPAATLEVVGDALIGEISINQNTISMDDTNGNLRLATSGTGTIEFAVPTQSTVGAAGGASALPASPDTYFKINVGGTDYVVPAFAVS